MIKNKITIQLQCMTTDEDGTIHELPSSKDRELILPTSIVSFIQSLTLRQHNTN